MRSGKPDIKIILSPRGRYTKIRENLYAKEVIAGDGERRKRYAIVFNPNEAKKDQMTRKRHLKTNVVNLAQSALAPVAKFLFSKKNLFASIISANSCFEGLQRKIIVNKRPNTNNHFRVKILPSYFFISLGFNASIKLRLSAINTANISRFFIYYHQ